MAELKIFLILGITAALVLWAFSFGPTVGLLALIAALLFFR